MPLSPTLKKALLASTACGQPDLLRCLEGEIDFIWECQIDGVCNDRLRYLYTQLGLIEAAQIFARHQIDTINRQFVHTINETYTARGARDQNAENTATGRACNWAAATSAQFFNRDST